MSTLKLSVHSTKNYVHSFGSIKGIKSNVSIKGIGTIKINILALVIIAILCMPKMLLGAIVATIIAAIYKPSVVKYFVVLVAILAVYYR